MQAYYVMDMEYSQTDKITACFLAKNETEARDKAKKKYPQARYYNVIRVFHTTDIHN